MDVESFLYNTLSPLVSSKVYPLVIPQEKVPPLIVYVRSEGEELRNIEGPMGIFKDTFQVDCWGTSFSSARDLSKQAKAALIDSKGTYSDLEVMGVWFKSQTDFYEPELNHYRCVSVYTILHRQLP